MFSDFRIHRAHDKLINEILEWIKTICTTFILVLLAFTYIGRTAKVNGQSMEPTLSQNDMLVLWSLGYKPKQGDIIACNCSGLGKVIVKRVIAVGGQTVDIDFSAGKVYVDGREFIVPGAENLTVDRESDLSYPITVPEGKYFVLGDNRRHSTDSRSSTVGLIDRDDILGRAIFRFLPISKMGRL